VTVQRTAKGPQHRRCGLLRSRVPRTRANSVPRDSAFFAGFRLCSRLFAVYEPIGANGSDWLSQAIFAPSAVFLWSHGGLYAIRYVRMPSLLRLPTSPDRRSPVPHLRHTLKGKTDGRESGQRLAGTKQCRCSPASSTPPRALRIATARFPTSSGLPGRGAGAGREGHDGNAGCWLRSEGGLSREPDDDGEGIPSDQKADQRCVRVRKPTDEVH
jgi:hypothetical protein